MTGALVLAIAHAMALVFLLRTKPGAPNPAAVTPAGIAKFSTRRIRRLPLLRARMLE
jgi:hypothetical protein